MPRALITGITGQDGSYLAEFLLTKGYEVHGLVRQCGGRGTARIQHLLDDADVMGKRLFVHQGDLADRDSLKSVLCRTEPDELYHLAGQTHVGLSFELVEATCDTAAMGTLRLLEAARVLPRPPKIFHASSSEIFGRPETAPQDEKTPFRPVTPYGCAKVFATQLIAVYRERFGLFASNGILYNHESPRRGNDFVTGKVCSAAAAIKEGLQSELLLGNLDSQRDWGDAREYVQGMWLVLQQEQPDDFIFATGKLHTVQDVVETAFEAVELDWHRYARQDPRLVRPQESVRLVGNPEKARRVLGWAPSTDFKALIREMTLARRQAEFR